MKPGSSDDRGRPRDGAASKTPPGAGGGADRLLGTVIDGRFKIRIILGEGGMGKVYLAEDQRLNNRRVALKMMGSTLTTNDEFRARFEREAVLQANLPHPQIVQILDMGESAHGSYIIMEYSEGRSLGRLLKELGPRSVDKALDTTEQILQVLDFAHGQSVVHRDLKPSNILVEERAGREHVRLLDFGIAKLLGSEGADLHQTLTRTGFAYGTLGYMAPEQACGDTEVLDHRADLYSTGIILHEMLTGSVPAPPESRTHPVRYAMWVQQNPIPPLSESHPDLQVSEEVDHILQKALRRGPENRYSSALAFLHDIREFRQSAQARTVARAPVQLKARSRAAGGASGGTTVTEALPRQQKTGAGAGSVVAWLLAVAAAGAGGWFFWQHREAEQQIKSLDQDISAVRSAVSEHTSWDGKDLGSGLTELKARIQELEASGDPDHLKELENGRDTALQERDAARKDLTEQRQKKDEATRALAGAQAKLQEAEAAQGRVAELEAEKTRLEKENTRLRAGGDPAEVEKLRGDVERLNNEIAAERGKLSAIFTSVDVADEVALRTKMQGLQADVTRLEGELATAQQGSPALQSKVTGLEGQLAEARRVTQEKERLLEAAQGDRDRARGQVTQLEGRLRQASPGEVTRLRNELSGLRSQLSNKDREIQALRQEKSSLQAQLTALNQRINPVPTGSPVTLTIRNGRSHPIKLRTILAIDHQGQAREVGLPPDDEITSNRTRTINVGAAREVSITYWTYSWQNKKFNRRDVTNRWTLRSPATTIEIPR